MGLITNLQVRSEGHMIAIEDTLSRHIVEKSSVFPSFPLIFRSTGNFLCLRHLQKPGNTQAQIRKSHPGEMVLV